MIPSQLLALLGGGPDGLTPRVPQMTDMTTIPSLLPGLAPLVRGQAGPSAALQGANPGLMQRLGGGINELFTGPGDPSLSDEQNSAVARQARLMAGLQGLMASQRGAAGAADVNPLSVLAQMAMTGQQYGAGLRGGMVENQIAQAEAAQQRRQSEMMAAAAASGQWDQMLQQAVANGNPQLIEAIVKAKEASMTPMSSPNYHYEEVLIDPTTGAISMDAESGVPARVRFNEDTGESMILGLSAPRSPGVTVNTGGPAGPSPNEALMSRVAEGEYVNLTEQARTAESRLASLGTMRALLDEGLQTGGLEGLTMPLREIAASVGIGDVENLGRQQLFRALSNKIALEMKGNMTGQMSDRDILFLQNQAPQLANTPEGNQLLIDILGQQARAQVLLQQAFADYLSSGQPMSGWERYRREFLQQNQISLAPFIAEWELMGGEN